MNLQIRCGLQWEKSRSDSWIKEKSAAGKSRHFLHFYIIQTNIIIFPTLQAEATGHSSEQVEADALVQMSGMNIGFYDCIELEDLVSGNVRLCREAKVLSKCRKSWKTGRFLQKTVVFQ